MRERAQKFTELINIYIYVQITIPNGFMEQKHERRQRLLLHFSQTHNFQFAVSHPLWQDPQTTQSEMKNCS